MKRRYNTARLQRRWGLRCIERGLYLDVIIRFQKPRSRADWFCEAIGFAKVHVFPYSKRQGTPAANLAGQVSEEIKQERVRRLMALGDTMARAYRERQLGQAARVLLEERRPDGRWEGYTPEYVHTLVEGSPEAMDALSSGQIVSVRVEKLTREGMAGTFVE